jgi:hypothetical protein
VTVDEREAGRVQVVDTAAAGMAESSVVHEEIMIRRREFCGEATLD